MQHHFSLQFLGATETVTGSKYLLSINDRHILIDCGLFQGMKDWRLRNWAKFPMRPQKIDAVLLTHAHIDHSGYLPLLVRNGFQGPIYATKATRDLCAILLPDSGYLHEEDARRANRYGYSKHHPALPLYTQEDGKKCLKQFQDVDFNSPQRIFTDLDITACWHYAGHILGASMVQLNINKKSILFSGDVGRPHDAIMHPPALIKETDYLVVESTYGDRQHEATDPKDDLAEIVNQTVKRGGSVLIPAFAVGRAQTILYYLEQLLAEKKIPRIPIFLDSPMAIDATQLLSRYSDMHRLSSEECRRLTHIAKYVNTQEDSKKLNIMQFSKIIISASGMATGGRVLHHLKLMAPHAKNTLLFAGFQAVGTRGEKIVAGAKTIKIHGEMIPVLAQVRNLNNISAHADQHELLSWLSHFSKAPNKVFITHGEPHAAKALAEKIRQQRGWHCEIPHYLEIVHC